MNQLSQNPNGWYIIEINVLIECWVIEHDILMRN